jgi:hypothetical protein
MGDSEALTLRAIILRDKADEFHSIDFYHGGTCRVPAGSGGDDEF